MNIDVKKFPDGVSIEYDDSHIIFIPYSQYPEIQSATDEQIKNVRINWGGLYWPDLDIDVALESLSDPEKFPLKWCRGRQITSDEFHRLLEKSPDVSSDPEDRLDE